MRASLAVNLVFISPDVWILLGTVGEIGYPLRGSETVIGIHIRRGDKITRELRHTVPASHYIDVAVDLATEAKKMGQPVPVRHIFNSQATKPAFSSDYMSEILILPQRDRRYSLSLQTNLTTPN